MFFLRIPSVVFMQAKKMLFRIINIKRDIVIHLFFTQNYQYLLIKYFNFYPWIAVCAVGISA